MNENGAGGYVTFPAGQARTYELSPAPARNIRGTPPGGKSGTIRESGRPVGRNIHTVKPVKAEWLGRSAQYIGRAAPGGKRQVSD